MRVAVLDDYQNMALEMADWSAVKSRCEVTVFDDHVGEAAALIERLAPYEIVCVMRERTPLTRPIIEALPRLRLIASTGPRNASIDATAAAERGIEVVHTGYAASPAVELCWGLILAGMREIVAENGSFRRGGWQRSVGAGLEGKTLGILGLGGIGTAMARIGKAFGMDAIAWSPNLTPERASSAGVELVDKPDLFARADVLTVHLVLAESTRGIVDAAMIERMKPGAFLVNTSRGPLVDEAALIRALGSRSLGGAAVDVFDDEPPRTSHPFRHLRNVLATPHIGYVTREQYAGFYGDTVRNIENWLAANK